MPNKSHGTNSQGNTYNTPGGTNSKPSTSYHYSNTNGGYYYSNDNGSTYTAAPSGQSTYTPPVSTNQSNSSAGSVGHAKQGSK